MSELRLDPETIDALAEQVATRIADWRRPSVDVPTTDPLLTLPAVAERLGCSAAVVRSYVRRGELIAYNVAGRWQVRESDIHAFLERRRVPSDQPEPAARTQRAPRRGRLAAALDHKG